MNSSRLNNRRVASGVFGLIWLFAASLAFADVIFLPSRAAPEHGPKVRSVAGILINGVIQPADRAEFANALRLLEADLKIHSARYFLLVTLDSSGGDVDTAIAIGTEIRKRLGFVQVPSEAKCLSSCVFLLAAGAQRVVSGVVGIHRSFLRMDAAVTPEQQRAQHALIGKRIRSYLDYVNIPQVLYEHMLRTPPEKIRYLSADELRALGLNENDPFIDDAMTAAAAKAEGLTKEQYFLYEQAARASCANFRVIPEYQKCRKMVRARF